MADRAAPRQIPRPQPSLHRLDVGRVKTSLRKPFDISPRLKWLTLVTLVLGLFLSMEWQAPMAKAPVTSDYPRELGRETVRRLEAEQKDLKQTIADLRSQLAELQKDAAGRKSALTNLNDQLDAQRVLAGTVPLVGSGVQVILDDSNVKSMPAGEDASHYIVHDYDIRDVVSLLWQSGAEAMAISGERVVGSTSIYCVGSTILVNDVRMSPPYKIVALGPPAMEEALNSTAHLQKLKASVRQYGVQLKVSQVRDSQVPAFTGGFSTRYARPGTSR